jgi:hypothetical protein
VTQALQLAGRSVGTAMRRSPYWLLAKRRLGRLEVLTTSLADGRRVLPIFSFEEEANLYLSLGAEGSWRVRQTEVGELLSLLYCLCNKVEVVALDPVSEIETDVLCRLVSFERERFVDVFLRRRVSAREELGSMPAPDGRRSASA